MALSGWLWQLFEQCGSVNIYLLYKDVIGLHSAKPVIEKRSFFKWGL